MKSVKKVGLKKKNQKKKTLEERVSFLEKAHKRRVEFKSVLAMYKLIKDIYAKIDIVDAEMGTIDKEIYDLKLRYGELARRVKKIELDGVISDGKDEED